MKLYRLTPFAKEAMTPAFREHLEQAAPADYLVHFGKGSGGWTCRILTPDLEVVGESFRQPSLTAAYMYAAPAARVGHP